MQKVFELGLEFSLALDPHNSNIQGPIADRLGHAPCLLEPD